jgi:hypothetical protein
MFKIFSIARLLTFLYSRRRARVHPARASRFHIQTPLASEDHDMPRTALGGLSITQLEQMLNRRRGEINELEKERRKIQQKLDALDQRIAALGGARGGGRAGRNGSGGRARNEKSLVACLEDVLSSGKPMQVGDIAEKVKACGYHSNSANFRGIVNQTLIKDKRFGSAGRGLYQLKK